MKLQLDKISTNGGTQARAGLNEAVVAEYAEAIIAGADMPPVTVFHDGKAHWLADGFHRFFAHKQARAIEIDAELRQGTKRDAILHSVGANAHHGLRRTNEDKRAAVRTLLRDKEWGKWSDRQIADACSVSHSFVAALRNPDRAAQQQANRDASAGRKVESDSTPGPQSAPAPIGVVTATTDPSKTAPQSHSSEKPSAAPSPHGENAEQRPPAAQEPHKNADSGPSNDEKQPVSTAPATSTGKAVPSAPGAAVAMVPLSDLEEARENARELADLLDGYTAAEKGEQEAAKEIAKLHGQLRVVESQRDQYMTTCNELKRSVKGLQRENDRLKKKLGQQG